MKQVLVLQLARLGDIVQTIPFLQALKADCECEVTLLVDKRLTSGIEDALPVEEVLPLDLQGMSQISAKGNILSEYFSFSQNLRHLQGRSFHIIYNLNRSTINALIISQLKCKSVYGFIPSGKVEDYRYSPSFRILFNQSRHRRLARMHLADSFRYLVPQPEKTRFPLYKIPPYGSDFAHKVIGGLKAEGFSPIVAIHLGAGAETRNWGTVNFAQTARILQCSLNIGIALIGSEEREAEVFLSGMGSKVRVLNLVGKTDLKQLAGVLSQADLTIGVDSGPLHLASAVGSKVLGLYFASAFVYETGPLGEGHYVLQVHPNCAPCQEDEPLCDKWDCRAKVTPSIVAETARYILTGSDLTKLPLAPEITLFQSQTDEYGQYYRPLKGDFKDDTEFYHTLWPFILKDNGKIKPAETLTPEAISAFENKVRKMGENPLLLPLAQHYFLVRADEGTEKAVAEMKEIILSVEL
jgi:ADP-heptose:LPS heptosyltransferase